MGSLEDFIHVSSSTAPNVSQACSIEHKPADIEKFPVCIHCRQPPLGCKSHDSFSLTHEHWVRQHHERRRSLAGYGFKSLVELGRNADLLHSKPHSQCSGGNLCA